ELIRALAETRAPGSVHALLDAARRDGPAAVRAAALAALRPFDSRDIAPSILEMYGSLPDEAQQAAREVLVSRAAWSRALVDAVASGEIDRETIPVSIARRLLLFDDEGLTAAVRAQWEGLDAADAATTLRRVE